MRTKICLTSFIAISFAMPAFAEGFPNDGYMQEDTIYEEAATYNNTGVYGGDVTAEAEYDDILYTINAGQYLPAAGEQVINCNVQGYFCPGVQNQVTYNASNAQGLTSCSSATDGLYVNSDGTGSNSDSCYRACSGNVTILHATSITGNDYYGNGIDTCEPTECENGWHVNRNPDLKTIIGVTQAGVDSGYRSNSGVGANKKEDVYGITDNGMFVVDYGNKGKITGHAKCSSRTGIEPWSNNTYSIISDNITNNLPETSGQYCYCQLDTYVSNNNDVQNLSSPWVLNYIHGDSSFCSSFCADNCADGLLNDAQRLTFRSGVFDILNTVLASCEANTINITWADVDPQYANQNNEGTAIYGGNINTPFKAVTKPGKTFKGWRFVKPSQQSGS